MEAVSAEERSEALEKLEDPALWTAQEGSHRSWLKALSTVLLDSGGVKSEALLLSRPLCLVRTLGAGLQGFGAVALTPVPPPRCGWTAVRGCCPSSFTPSFSRTPMVPGESRSPPAFGNSSVVAAVLRPPVALAVTPVSRPLARALDGGDTLTADENVFSSRAGRCRRGPAGPGLSTHHAGCS